MAHISVAECRAILGNDAVGRSDTDIERLRDSLETLALVMYEEIARQAQADPDSVRWAAYAFENPDDATLDSGPDEGPPIDGRNLLDFPEER